MNTRTDQQAQETSTENSQQGRENTVYSKTIVGIAVDRLVVTVNKPIEATVSTVWINTSMGGNVSV